MIIRFLRLVNGAHLSRHCDSVVTCPKIAVQYVGCPTSQNIGLGRDTNVDVCWTIFIEGLIKIIVNHNSETFSLIFLKAFILSDRVFEY